LPVRLVAILRACRGSEPGRGPINLTAPGEADFSVLHGVTVIVTRRTCTPPLQNSISTWVGLIGCRNFDQIHDCVTRIGQGNVPPAAVPGRRRR
jgi:hypothetical protein